ncbi:hypothetical protein [Streptomyces sp. NPDC001568]|uniref:hypothetical protein n=1 Tax=Streptomyces sp. NPDC001568 TaxID=3364588 RepID=UPI0036ACC484
MADARRTTRHPSVASLLRPAPLGPGRLAETLTAAARNARRRRAAGTAAVCATAGEHRTCPGRDGASAPDVVGGSRCQESPASGDRRERAHEAVESRTTGPDDLASLLAMLDLRRPADGE